jgi:hypothetical protein
MKSFLLLLIWLLLPIPAMAADPGRDVIASVKVLVYHATDGDPAVAGAKATEVSEETAKWFASKESLRFANYRLLGSESKPLYRSYENWAQPIEGSEEILCRFEVASRLSKDSVRIDLELWLSRKKILKSGVVLTAGKPVVVLGPQWRGGRMIVSVELAPATNKGQ